MLKIKYAFFIFSIKEVNFTMKNRTAIGIVCIVLAVAVTFIVSPLVNNISDKKTEVVRFVADVSHGSEISEEDIELVEISNSALPEKVIKDKTAVVGKDRKSVV